MTSPCGVPVKISISKPFDNSTCIPQVFSAARAQEFGDNIFYPATFTALGNHFENGTKVRFELIYLPNLKKQF